MQSLNDDERKEVLGEVLADELRVITEYVKDIPEMKRDIRALNERLASVESNVKEIKAVVMEYSTDLDDHERRITRLEAA